jgi:hypothetical protein
LSHLIINGSCLSLRPEQLPESACMFADPPYSAHVHENSEANIGASAQVGVRKRSLGFEPLTDELRLHIAALGARCRWSVVFSDWEGLGGWKAAFDAQPGYRYVRVVPWIRWSAPQRTGDRPPSGSEAIILAGREGRMRWAGPGNLTHLDELCERGADKHTTAKPLDLMLRLVSYFSEPGELIVDPTCGRGTAVLAARLLGRPGLGLEIDPAEAALAQERVASEALSERDAERARRYAERLEVEKTDAVRRAAATAKVVARKRKPATLQTQTQKGNA